MKWITLGWPLLRVSRARVFKRGHAVCFKTHYETMNSGGRAREMQFATRTALKSALSRMLTTPTRNCDFYICMISAVFRFLSFLRLITFLVHFGLLLFCLSNWGMDLEQTKELNLERLRWHKCWGLFTTLDLYEKLALLFIDQNLIFSILLKS